MHKSSRQPSYRKTTVEIAHTKTGIAFFDYQQRKVVPVPRGFRERMLKAT